ncbi:MAG TPA: TfuA-related McrA-glycine thioamidation protein [Methanofastidiosum sp.]|nr:TfuA-related McrA-glycine thioamidation protein [Methanofastidiosum sp.]HPA49014.1 TfuA-related McrA-glycine thioamidation protein [Methanofastidiosum sp.]HQK62386.1 TfuA-related McrA-glycine thioamidation protein [Methanofastidiosum sp.]HQM94978.1 TfuA-related McrA-glycine thioamidation protein [Methanofastidiosum sp.]HQQ48345.1 TfuA-related McrA-glycine thioamidation protein [Methanofastidiosum sp.]
MIKIIIYLGPSLPVDEAKKLLHSNNNREVTYAPPIKRGDIPKAISENYQVIGIIDGIFFRESAVSPREIMEVLKSNIKVYGASSMGALRASELDRYGMVGIGKIYNWYRDGTLNSDDEVALSFDSEEFIPISEPLVNIRETMKKALSENIINQEEYKIIFESAKKLYFPERKWKNIIQISEKKMGKNLSYFSDFVKTQKVDVKKEDAILLLKEIDRYSK